jgi:hypothetical protein
VLKELKELIQELKVRQVTQVLKELQVLKEEPQVLKAR